MSGSYQSVDEFKIMGLGDITQTTAQMFRGQIHRAPALRGPNNGILGIGLCVREYDTANTAELLFKGVFCVSTETSLCWLCKYTLCGGLYT